METYLVILVKTAMAIFNNFRFWQLSLTNKYVGLASYFEKMYFLFLTDYFNEII